MLSVMDSLDRTRIVPIAFCPNTGPLTDELRARDISQFHWPDSFNRTDESSQQAVADWWNQRIVECGLDLLHANSLTMSRRMGRIASRLACATTGHVRDIMKFSRNAAAELHQHRRLIAVSHAVETALAAQGIQPGKIETIYNGVDLQRFHPRTATGWLLQELKLPMETKLVATIGQICLRKAQSDLAAAAVLLRDRIPDLHFLLIGKRHSRKPESVAFDDAITAVFRESGMEHRLHRLQFRSDIAEILPEIDLLAHPARQEPLGRVLLEAAACGTPIVATRVGGTEEILTHDVSGWLVSPASPGELAEGMEIALQSPERASRWGAAARRNMEKRFSANLSAEKLLKCWQQILVEHGGDFRCSGLLLD